MSGDPGIIPCHFELPLHPRNHSLALVCVIHGLRSDRIVRSSRFVVLVRSKSPSVRSSTSVRSLGWFKVLVSSKFLSIPSLRWFEVFRPGWPSAFGQEAQSAEIWRPTRSKRFLHWRLRSLRDTESVGLKWKTAVALVEEEKPALEERIRVR